MIKNYLWVIEYNGHPKELKTSWDGANKIKPRDFNLGG
jgi:hypothetical protein